MVFADGDVGLSCVKYLIETRVNIIDTIVVTNESSLVFKELNQLDLESTNIIFVQDVDQYKFNNIEYFLLLWWPFILKEEVIKIPKIGVINTHPSLLPFNRGKNYNFWNLVEDVPFGVTLHFINEGIDSGDIIFQKEIVKTWEDNGKTLYEKAQREMVKLFKEKIDDILNLKYIRKKQNLNQGSYHNGSELEPASEIFLEKKYTAKDLLNLLRARVFPPYNSCYFYENGDKYEVKIKIEKVENGSYKRV